MADNKTSTTKKTVEIDDIDAFLGINSGAPIAANNPEADAAKIFKKEKVDTSFIDNPDPVEDEGKKENPDNPNGKKEDDPLAEKIEDEEIDASLEAKEQAKKLLEEIDDPSSKKEEDEDEEEDLTGKSKPTNAGRKGALVEAVGNLVKKGTLDLFEDAQDVESYTAKDLEDLIEVNINQKLNEVAQKAPMEVFNNLDPRLQEAVAYQLNGGKDIASVLKAVAQSQEVTDLSLENEKDQERIVREWLRSSNVLDLEEIEDEIASIIDRGDLEKKATQFKPKLDAKQSSIVEEKLKKQEDAKNRAEKAKEQYGKVIYTMLNKPQLNGIPLNNKVQTMLYYGLTDDSNYQDRNGNPVNALGHLIEEYQFGEKANPSVLLEALWLMADPNGYRNAVTSLGKNEAASESFRKLKTAEGEKITSSNKTGDKREAPTRTVKRKAGSRNIFSRD
jgi:hypothetical protein